MQLGKRVVHEQLVESETTRKVIGRLPPGQLYMDSLVGIGELLACCFEDTTDCAMSEDPLSILSP